MQSIVLNGLVTIAGLALGLAWCFGLAVIDWAAWFLVLPSRRAGSLARDLVPGEDERALGVPIDAVAPDGVQLAGLWHEPGSNNPDAHGRTVLVLHGFAEDPATLRERMEALGRHGWNVAALDTRAHGRSGGDRSSFGGREADDVRTWIDRLVGLEKLGSASIVAVWGRSMGAAVALRAAASDRRVTAIVLESPYVDLEATLASLVKRKRVPLSQWVSRAILRRAEVLAGVSLTRPRPIDLAPGIRAPVLILHGASDRLTPPDEAQRLASAFPCRAEVVEVPGAGHIDVIKIGGDRLLERIATFLDESVERPMRAEPATEPEPTRSPART